MYSYAVCTTSEWPVSIMFKISDKAKGTHSMSARLLGQSVLKFRQFVAFVSYFLVVTLQSDNKPQANWAQTNDVNIENRRGDRHKLRAVITIVTKHREWVTIITSHSSYTRV